MRARTKRRHLEAIGIPVWVLRSRDEPGAASGPGSSEEPGSAAASHRGRPGGPAAAAPDPGEAPQSYEPPRSGRGLAADVASPEWARLAEEVRSCTLCGLHATRTQTVFGVGRRDADLLVVGEAPGADEDRQGEPFVGRAGQLLNAMLKAIGLEREEVYIANILKCRPPGNRDPKPEEQARCTPYLDRQIELIRPRAILAVGRIAAQWLLQSDQTIGRLRGRVLRYGESHIPIVVTYHPAYLLRTPLAKSKAWQDLVRVKELISSNP